MDEMEGAKSVTRSTMKRTAIKKRPRKKRDGDDAKYLAWIRTQPCLICCRVYYFGGQVDEAFWPAFDNRLTITEAAHVGVRGMGQKCSDRETVPLCGVCHRTGPESHHVLGKRFWLHHLISKSEVLEKLVEMYEKEVNGIRR